MEKVNILLWALLLSLLHWMAYCLPQVLWCLTSGTDLWYAFDLFYLLSAVGWEQCFSLLPCSPVLESEALHLSA